ncbi:DUF4136 domain-containing protein [Fulvivirga sp. RKSG066]|uniref:DUF4136 domain-containing protein n=1 Tax=Fulvivirga aurantia TaxID=2529383 RepID=UPI0012BD6DDE|nr:DUF4136 domain-containing protein [Fulvivirga aurantia]MTI22851.1 DUF4136 domain-containing protein [Fulvivirga aurantia]
MTASKYTLIFFLVFTLTSSCFLQQELPVEYDYSYRGRFDKYDTYDFVVQNDVRNFGNSQLKNLISSSIESHMKFLGYRQKERKPDLLLSFSVFIDSLSLRGYNQPKIEDWVKRPDRDLDYNKQNFAISKGTVFIQFFDRRQNASIWQGYATDKYNSVDLADSRDVQNAVKSILNKYQFFSQDFLKRQQELRKQGEKTL